MEPVISPITIARVIQPDRVRRAKSRGDSGKGSPFSNHLRREKEGSSGSQSPPQEESDFLPAMLAAEDLKASSDPLLLSQTDGGAPSGKKLIDVRV